MRILFFVFIALTTLYASSDAAKELGYYSDYNSALAIAKQEHKPLMLVVVTSYCPWCRKFERKSLASKKVAPMVKAMFVPVIVDRNKDAEMFPKKFQTPRIPTVFFVDPKDGKEYWKTIGYLSKGEFAEALEDAEVLFKKRREK